MCTRYALFTVSAVALLTTPGAPADSFALDWWTVDGGGAMFSTGGAFELSGTIGQPDAQPQPVMAGGSFTLTGGFWSLPAPLRGDMNCDGKVNLDDINPFVTALIDRNGYKAQYPGCPWLNGDIDESGQVNFGDINGFVICLISGGCP